MPYTWNTHEEQRDRYPGRLGELIWTDDGRRTLASFRKRHLSDGSRQSNKDQEARQGDETPTRE